MSYFRNIKTVDGLKKRYKKLSLQLHPDINSLNISETERTERTAQFIEMENEYRKLYKKFTDPPPEPEKDSKNQKRPNFAKNREKTTSTNAQHNTKQGKAIPNIGLKNNLKNGLKNFANSGFGTIVLDETENALNNIVSKTLHHIRKKISD